VTIDSDTWDGVPFAVGKTGFFIRPGVMVQEVTRSP